MKYKNIIQEIFFNFRPFSIIYYLLIFTTLQTEADEKHFFIKKAECVFDQEKVEISITLDKNDNIVAVSPLSVKNVRCAILNLKETINKKRVNLVVKRKINKGIFLLPPDEIKTLRMDFSAGSESRLDRSFTVGLYEHVKFESQEEREDLLAFYKLDCELRKEKGEKSSYNILNPREYFLDSKNIFYAYVDRFKESEESLAANRRILGFTSLKKIKSPFDENYQLFFHIVYTNVLYHGKNYFYDAFSDISLLEFPGALSDNKARFSIIIDHQNDWFSQGFIDKHFRPSHIDVFDISLLTEKDLSLSKSRSVDFYKSSAQNFQASEYKREREILYQRDPRFSFQSNRQLFQDKILRELIDLSSEDVKKKRLGKVYYFTSGIPGAGKSYVLELLKKSNFFPAFPQGSEDVLEIDCDNIKDMIYEEDHSCRQAVFSKGDGLQDESVYLMDLWKIILKERKIETLDLLTQGTLSWDGISGDFLKILEEEPEAKIVIINIESSFDQVEYNVIERKLRTERAVSLEKLRKLSESIHLNHLNIRKKVPQAFFIQIKNKGTRVTPGDVLITSIMMGEKFFSLEKPVTLNFSNKDELDKIKEDVARLKDNLLNIDSKVKKDLEEVF